MTKKTATAAPAVLSKEEHDAQIADAARALIRLLIPLTAQGKGAAAPAAAADEEDEVEDEEEEVVELPALDRDKVASMGIKDLRSTAKEYLGDDAPTKKQDILEALEEFYDDAEEAEDEDDEDEVEEVEEDEDEEEGLSRDDLEEMDLKALRVLAKENGFKSADYRGMDQDALIDLLMGEDEDEEEDEEADEVEEDEEDEEEVEEIDEDALNEMSLTELKSLAKEIGVKVKVPASAKTDAKKKKVYVEAILESGEE